MNQGTTGSSSAVDPPMKRRRGRPRKDESLVQGENTAPLKPGSDSTKKNKQSVVTSGAAIGCDMVGQVVSGVIEGSFDAGYLLKVRVGDTDTHLRGVVFLPGRFSPITTANDVAPQTKMYKRTEMPIPVSNPGCIPPPSEKCDKLPVDQKPAPTIVPVPDEQGLPSKFQSTVPVALPNQTLTHTLPIGTTVVPTSLEGKAMPQQILASGLMNRSASSVAQSLHDKITKQDELMQEFEASIRKGTNASVEASEQTKSVALPLKNDLQIHNQVAGDDFKPNQLVHDLDKTTPNQSPIISGSGTTISSEPVQVNVWMEKQASSQDPAIAVEILSGNDSSDLNGMSTSHAANFSEAPTNAVLVTPLPALMFEREGVPLSTKLQAEGSPLQRMIDHQSSSTSVAADSASVPMTNLATTLFERETATTESKAAADGPVLPTMTKPLFCSSSGAATSVDCNIKDDIPSTES